jgi:hypothetical protein
VGFDVATAVPALLVAVMFTRVCVPVSAEVRTYLVLVAWVIDEQVEMSVVVQRSH